MLQIFEQVSKIAVCMAVFWIGCNLANLDWQLAVMSVRDSVYSLGSPFAIGQSFAQQFALFTGKF